MANWAAYKEKEIGLPVVKRALHGIHFDKGKGEILAEFTGKPCHYFDGKEYKAIDTKPLLRKDGSYGCPHSDVIIKPDGTVQVGTYYQKAALIYPQSLKVDGDRLVREFSGGRQYLYITENGFRQEIVLDKLPDLKKVSVLVDTVSGVLPSKYTLSTLTAKDADGVDLSLTDSKTLASVLEAAKYPLTIDPDFVSDSADGSVYGINANFSTARSTSSGFDITGTIETLGIYWSGTYYQIGRMFLKFDTSSIGGSSVVTQVNLKVQLSAAYSTNLAAWDAQIVKQDWSAYDPITADNMEAIFNACLSGTADDNILFATDDGLARRTWYTSGNLSTSWIAKDGNTYYSLRSSNDYNNSEPSPAANESLRLFTSEEATYGKPTLTVLYTAGGTFIPVNMMANAQNLTAGMRG